MVSIKKIINPMEYGKGNFFFGRPMTIKEKITIWNENYFQILFGIQFVLQFYHCQEGWWGEKRQVTLMAWSTNWLAAGTMQRYLLSYLKDQGKELGLSMVSCTTISDCRHTCHESLPFLLSRQLWSWTRMSSHTRQHLTSRVGILRS